jgi:hypothetical protein
MQRWRLGHRQQGRVGEIQLAQSAARESVRRRREVTATKAGTESLART